MRARSLPSSHDGDLDCDATTGSRRGAALAMLLAAACTVDVHPSEDPEVLPALDRVGEQVVMGVADGVQVCGRSLEFMDEFVARYVAESADGAPVETIEYYVLSPASVTSLSACGPANAACSRDGVVFASSPIVVHELVHSVRRLQPDAAPGMGVLEEGLAQLHFTYALGWDETFAPSRLPEYLDGDRPADIYEPAAHLLGIIEHETDFATVEAFVDASSTVDDAASLDALAQEIVGLDLETLDGLYESTPQCSTTERARLLVTCAAEPLAWQGPTDASYVEVEPRPLACDDADVIGPLDDRLWLEHAVDIPLQGTYRLSVDVEPGQRLQLVSCDRGCNGGVDVDWTDAARSEDIELTAGTYVLRLSRALADDRTIGVRIEAL